MSATAVLPESIARLECERCGAVHNIDTARTKKPFTFACTGIVNNERCGNPIRFKFQKTINATTEATMDNTNSDSTEKKSRKPREEKFSRLKWSELAVFHGLVLDRKATLANFEAAMDKLEEEVKAAGYAPGKVGAKAALSEEIDPKFVEEVRKVALPAFRKHATENEHGIKTVRADKLANLVFFAQHPGELPESDDISRIMLAMNVAGFTKADPGARGQFFSVTYREEETTGKAKRK